jgi:hypothetical protein
MSWDDQAKAALERLQKDKLVYYFDVMALVIDFVVRGAKPSEIERGFGCKTDLMVTALGHVTKALQKGGSVKPLSEGGWYAREDDAYVVAPGFATAWKTLRKLTSLPL